MTIVPMLRVGMHFVTLRVTSLAPMLHARRPIPPASPSADTATHSSPHRHTPVRRRVPARETH
ncbi:hypothetical protein FFH21_007475 [Pseudomonas sp. KBS0707]|nr:hypothetical protein FFH21_007475 [Pseudomonas sp. KBS0707]